MGEPPTRGEPVARIRKAKHERMRVYARALCARDAASKLIRLAALRGPRGIGQSADLCPRAQMRSRFIVVGVSNARERNVPWERPRDATLRSQFDLMDCFFCLFSRNAEV